MSNITSIASLDQQRYNSIPLNLMLGKMTECHQCRLRNHGIFIIQSFFQNNYYLRRKMHDLES